jgi:hypothetical protein
MTENQGVSGRKRRSGLRQNELCENIERFSPALQLTLHLKSTLLRSQEWAGS